MTIIITMAGLGLRFKNAGYNLPKYMITVKNKTLFEWSLESLIGYNEFVENYIFVVRKDDNSLDFIKSKILNYGILNFKIIELDHLTDGQATTCLIALRYCKPESPIMVYNIDTFIEPYQLQYSQISGQGHIPCFKGKGDHWSFVKINDEARVVEVREKVRISELCTLGAYYFSSAKLFRALYKFYYFDKNEPDKSEKYIAPLYNEMIKRGLDISISLVESSKVYVLGTPEELKEFINS